LAPGIMYTNALKQELQTGQYVGGKLSPRRLTVRVPSRDCCAESPMVPYTSRTF
jgi:hypothetical protein